MKVSTLSELRRHLTKDMPQRIWIVCEDDAEKEQVSQMIAEYLEVARQFFTIQQLQDFFVEIATFSLFREPRVVCLKNVETLKAEALCELEKALQELAPNLFVCLEATSLKGKFAQHIEAKGLVYQPAAEKTWEAEKRICEELIEYSAGQGVVLPMEVAKVLVASVGPQRQLLHQELEKLLCYLGEKKNISHEDLQAVSLVVPQKTLWQLTDALFADQTRQAWQTLCELLQEQMAPLAILGSLRTQTQTALSILQLSEEGGAEAVRAQFPYLKGGLYDKKISVLRRYSKQRLVVLLQRLFEAECSMKDNAYDMNWPLEKIILQVT